MEYKKSQAVYDKIIELMNYYLYEGHEPSFDLGPNWWYAILCECIALLKHRPILWDKFNDDQHARMTQLMKMFAYMWNFGCNKRNNYDTGWGLKGNFGKWRGPNYRLTNNILILFIEHFFGGMNEVNKILLTMNYNDEVKALKEFGFNNALKSWLTAGYVDSQGKVLPSARELIEKGGDAYIKQADYGFTNYYKRGSGAGVKIPVEYQDSIPYGVIHSVFNNCFSGGECVSKVVIEQEDYECSIADGSETPMLGRDGMMLEFNLEDDGLGRRSSLFHCATDFYLMSGAVVALWFLRISKVEVYKGYEKIQAGITDFLYKVNHGYKGWCLGSPENISLTNFSGLTLWANYWSDHYNINLD